MIWKLIRRKKEKVTCSSKDLEKILCRKTRTIRKKDRVEIEPTETPKRGSTNSSRIKKRRTKALES